MVLAWKVGVRRNPAVAFFLAIVSSPGTYLLAFAFAAPAAFFTDADSDGLTASDLFLLLMMPMTHGITTTVWRAKAHSEVMRQFELEREGHHGGLAWYLLGFFVPISWVAYDYIFASNVRHVRRRFGFGRSMHPVVFAVAPVAPLVGLLAAEIWLIVLFHGDGPVPEGLVPLVFAFAGVSLAAVIVAAAAVHARLQKDLNGLWGAMDRRVDQLLAEGRAPITAGGGAPIVPAQPTWPPR